MEKIINFFKSKYDFFLLLFLILVIIGPFLFSKGYFLSIDWVYGPNTDLIDTQYYPNYIVWLYIQKLLSLFLPPFLIQKIIILAFFIVSIFSIKKFLKIFFKDNRVILIGIIFFIFNYFVYSRLAQGQIYILYAYSLLPLVFYYLLKKKYLRLGIISSLIVSFSPHFIFLLFLIFTLDIILFFDKEKFLKYFLVFGLVLLFNLYWIFIIFKTTNVSNFSINDLYAFSSKSVYFSNIYLEILSFHGFWGDKFKHYYLINNLNYKLVFLILFILMLLGTIKSGFYIKIKIYFLLLLIFSFILSLGISENNFFSTLNLFFYKNIPFYLGLRDATKWQTLYIISFILFFSFGVKYILRVFNNKFIYLLLIILVIGYTNKMLFSLSGQLIGYKYPSKWKDIKTLINKNNVNGKILCFPWHQSMSYKFIRGKVVSNLCGVYFGTTTLFGDNIEIGNIYSQSIRKESKIIEKYVAPWGLFRDSITIDKIKQFIQDLKGLGVEYIILLKEVDWNFYEKFLEKAKDLGYLAVMKDNDMVRLYKIK